VCLAGAVVWILAEDDDTDLIQWREVEGPEPVGCPREDRSASIALGHEEALKFIHVRLLEFAAQWVEPALVEFDR
jgi:hypothetical protein